ncbi:hypothetical protein WICPIJ_005712 [Wickerhamomyces pijperi]|uniref:Probable endonuclease LCL3 n=1 Tax=Wickerhamomyces pijperi TaxID=599730 RepID=A0A9P8Q3G1_WICPI|nr:hypothetical protein WICPIJ_005712 [Wickerhamomyces pijperi]
MPPSKQDQPLLTPTLLLSTTIATTVSLVSISIFKRLQPFNSIHSIPKSYFNTGKTIYGRVTSVGDGDNFHMIHTPGGLVGGWGWFRRIPGYGSDSKHKKLKGKSKSKASQLKGKTIPVRLYAIDAPERPHFGHKEQPHSLESLQWLRSRLLDNYIRVKPFKVDQYGRVVGKVKVYPRYWRWWFGWDVSKEMVKKGMAVVYESCKSGEYDGQFEHFKKLENRAKFWQRGLWAKKFHTGGRVVTPGEYKGSLRGFADVKKEVRQKKTKKK